MKYLIKFLFIASLMFCCSCNINARQVPDVPKLNTKVKVILITVDGARWQDVLYGTDPMLSGSPSINSRELLPNFYHYLVDQGIVVGQKSLMTASNSAHVSLPGYLEIMRGYATFDCLNNSCDPILTTTIADYFDDSAVFSSWDTIRKAVSNNSARMSVNCGRRFRSDVWNNKSLPDNQSFEAKDFEYDPLYRPDEFTQKAALDYFYRFHPSFMWVALGDTDEYAHMGNYSAYIKALQSADQFLGTLMKDPESASYVIIVTVDHGRSADWRSHGRDPESARVWLMMRGPNIPVNYQAHFNSTMSLANIFPTILGLLNNEVYLNSLLVK